MNMSDIYLNFSVQKKTQNNNNPSKWQEEKFTYQNNVTYNTIQLRATKK